VHGTEGFSWSHLNALGMRGPDVGPKHPAEKRVLFLGDSFTEAFQVPRADSYPEVLASALSTGGASVTSVNAGRNGASPASYLHLAQYYRSTFEPDAVVIQLSEQDVGSDLDNPNRNFYLEKTSSGYRTVFNEGFRSANPIVQNNPWIENVLGVPAVRLAGDTLSKAAQGISAGSQPPVTESVPTDREFDQAGLDWVVDSLAREYPDAVIAFVPELDYFGDPARTIAVERALQAAAARNGLTFVNPRTTFADVYAATHVPATGFNNTRPGKGHLNRTGHRILAEQLLPVLAERLAP